MVVVQPWFRLPWCILIFLYTHLLLTLLMSSTQFFQPQDLENKPHIIFSIILSLTDFLVCLQYLKCCSRENLTTNFLDSSITNLTFRRSLFGIPLILYIGSLFLIVLHVLQLVRVYTISSLPILCIINYIIIFSMNNQDCII